MTTGELPVSQALERLQAARELAIARHRGRRTDSGKDYFAAVCAPASRLAAELVERHLTPRVVVGRSAADGVIAAATVAYLADLLLPDAPGNTTPPPTAKSLGDAFGADAVLMTENLFWAPDTSRDAYCRQLRLCCDPAVHAVRLALLYAQAWDMPSPSPASRQWAAEVGEPVAEAVYRTTCGWPADGALRGRLRALADGGASGMRPPLHPPGRDGPGA